MVLGDVFEDWRQRLAVLRAARRSPGSELEAWLLEIRIRILGFLVRRYGGDEEDAGTDVEPDRRFDALFREEQPRRPGRLDPADRWYGIDHPPQAAEQMTPALHRIRDLNDGVRLRRGGAGPETAWRWWADTYCRAPGRGSDDAGGDAPPGGSAAATGADDSERPA